MKPKRLGSYLVIGDWGWDENAHGRLAQRAEKGDTADTLLEHSVESDSQTKSVAAV